MADITYLLTLEIGVSLNRRCFQYIEMHARKRLNWNYHYEKEK